MEIHIEPNIKIDACSSESCTTMDVTIVIFGASGDLTKRKLIPALYHLYCENLISDNITILGVARRDLSETFTKDMIASLRASITHEIAEEEEESLNAFSGMIQYQAMNFDDADAYRELKRILQEMRSVNYLFYLAVAPSYFSSIISNLGAVGLAEDSNGFSRIIIEKPFGHDLQSAVLLNQEVNRIFDEKQVFRIDHYLGKETVQNILVFRFANSIFESVWNRNHIDNIQILVAETIGIESRGEFYDKAGVLRDVMQNHMMELLSYVTMEPPGSFEANAVRIEKLKILRAIKPINMDYVVRGQYALGQMEGNQVLGYREEDRVNPESNTETYAAMELEIENWRWAGVPIYIRAGKRLMKHATEIAIQFKEPPLLMFKGSSDDIKQILPNLLIIRIQPDEGISLRFGAKIPGPHNNVTPVIMDFQYENAFQVEMPNGYERLLLDAINGDQTLFAHRDSVETTWRLFTPVLEAWASQKPIDFPNYRSGSWGPKVADSLIGRDGRKWNNP